MRPSLFRGGLATALMLLALSARPAAHDIPVDVVVHVFVKPDGNTLNLVVRVPLKAMRDIDFPKRGPGMLDIAQADATLRDAAVTWLAHDFAVYEDDAPLGTPAVVAALASLPSDPSFKSYESARAHVTGPRLPDDTEIAWEQGMLDAWLTLPIRSDRARFSVRPTLARLGLRVVTVLRFLPPDGALRAFEYTGDPGLVRLDPRWHQAALLFVKGGFFHILDGTDHLLFLLCLVIPFRRIRALVLIVTAFTVAHSVTLIGSAYGLAPDALWFPPLVETLIAMSIVYMALENIVGATRVERRWLVTFAFGLVHGFGFSFALRESLQFAGAHLLTSLLSFNAGVELGQLLVLAVLVPALQILFRYVVEERMGTIILSAFVAHTAWHWTTERGEQLRQYAWPTLDAAVLASALRWLMAAIAVGAGLWFASRVRHHRAAESVRPQE